MAKSMLARHPFEWAYAAVISAFRGSRLEPVDAKSLIVKRIGFSDLRYALERGFADFKEGRTDAAFLCIFYPLAGLVLVRLIVGEGLLPLLFPLVAGFALVSPLLATGVYQMSRIKEKTGSANWADAFSAFKSPAIGSILLLGIWLVGVYLLWLGTAGMLYSATFGPNFPTSYSIFLHDLILTRHGWALIGFGIGTGALFASLVLTICIVSFPLLLDRNTGVRVAVETSLRATKKNVGMVMVWGVIVAALLILGSLPFLIGLIVVFPVLGHATWHLYRRLVVPW